MSHNKFFIPLTRLVLEKAIKDAEIENTNEEKKLISSMGKVILYDDDVNVKINSLVEELMVPPPEPKVAITFRAILRPTITLFLTITFIFLVFGQVGMIGEIPTDPNAAGVFFKRWDKSFTVFLAIYGPIIGFWFGERTVEKKGAN
ncbi:MAG: hypothetical protein U9R66_06445 [Thermodesulfobacteriota bacterium]|nr:hypothetical protein [Thermodesulfobacteriota bacterium]